MTMDRTPDRPGPPAAGRPGPRGTDAAGLPTDRRQAGAPPGGDCNASVAGEEDPGAALDLVRTAAAQAAPIPIPAPEAP